VGVVIAAIVGPNRTSQREGWGGWWCVFLFSVCSSAFLLVFSLLSIVAALYYFLSAILESSDFYIVD